MRVFKTKWFTKFARKESVAESRLIEVIREIESGLIDADYGGGLIKKRIAREGGGKSGGYRTLIAYRSETMAVFLFCFAKNDRQNLDDSEVAGYKSVVAIYLGFDDTEIETALEKKEIEEMEYHDKKI